MTEADVRAFEACIRAGGVALFPADTVYGLATSPDSRPGFDRLYEIKRRPPTRPSAVMWFALEQLLAALLLGPRTRAALEALLPGAVTVIVANPQRIFPLACAGIPDRIGVRLPAFSGAAAPLNACRVAVLQSSANLSGETEARRIEDVDERVRSAVDVELDGGELPGIPSTVVDLSAYEAGGAHRVLREGAVAAAKVAHLLGA